MDLTPQEAKKLLQSQLNDWGLARTNYEALKNVRTKEFRFDGFIIRVQFNPARILSSAAKVDAKSIQERKCFLCPDNLPKEQEGIPFGNDYQILVNPFPIFPEHFTIPAYEHAGQLILNRYGDMLDLAKSLDKYTVFYNGPGCGASAPDHAHFQAGIKGFLPIEEDMDSMPKETIYKAEEINVSVLRNYLRNCFLIETKDKEKAICFFNLLYSLLDIKEDGKEPMMNIITWYENNIWYSCIFPREKHRPGCFFAEGDDNLLISPASVDLGGVFITPLEKDFDKITRENISDILKEICIDTEKMQSVVNKIKESIWNQK
jgi:ATP adenylyltransferase/5',5'''-P-1,P-4-tetraphosphate phosphorylase II